MKPANNAPFYAAGLYPKLAEVFRSHGYALAIHGSVARDFDLIAVPWVDEAGDPQTVIAEVLEKFAVKYAGSDNADARPHGRLAFKLALSFADHALDISFTPRLPTPAGVKCAHPASFDANGSPVEPACQHDLLKPGTTIEVIDKWKAKCLVCIEFFDLPGRPDETDECLRCAGAGKVEAENPDEFATCPDCDGRGAVSEEVTR